MEPVVAVAIAVYNDERYLKPTLEALCAQTFKDFQVTIQDDGSTDRSTEIATEYLDRLPLTLVRSPHLGRHDAKRGVAEAALARAPYLLTLDSDIVLPPDAIARMLGLLEADPKTAAVCAHARSSTERRWGTAQAFVEDAYLYSNTDLDGNSRWVVGGCALYRSELLRSLQVRSDMGEDHDISEKLRAKWRLLVPRTLVATHLGVPTTLWGLIRRGSRDGARVHAYLRVYPHGRQLGNVARLVPLPLAAVGLAGGLLGGLWIAGAVAFAFLGYVLLFLIATRRVPGSLWERAAGTFGFVAGNLGFCVGYLRDLWVGRKSAPMNESSRSY